MAEQKEAKVSVSLEKGSDKAPPIVYGATGYTGLVTLGGRIWDECSSELLWPRAFHTYKKMALSSAVSPALEYVEGKAAEAEWVVRVPKGYEQELKEKAEYLRQVMHDMDHTWTTFIKNALTFNRYGFSISEIVMRFRNKKYGSKYDDGLVGLEGLQPRGQGTIDHWYWFDKGRKIGGFYQRTVTPTENDVSDGWNVIRSLATQEVSLQKIPRKKFLLFRHNPENDSPTGRSPLASVWACWKLLEAFQESEIIGTAQDNNAFKILYLPPEYLVEDADEDRKASFQMYQKMMERAHQAKQSGFILPMLVDQDGNKMFDFEIKNISGTKSYDVEKIIERLTREIQVGLFADVLSLGGDGGGSFSLAESKVSFLEMAVRSRLNEIKDQLNHQLVKTLFEQNGWSLDGGLPYFDYELPNSETLDNKSKAYQRIKAVGLIPVVPQVVNQVMTDLGIDYQVPDDMSTEDLMKLLDPLNEGMQSESGGGMESGLPNSNGSGTGSSGDSSISNSENT